MRKLTILLGLAALAASTTGCCGRCTSWFKKGSPCGTTMTPAVLSAPMVMGAPMAGPVMQPCCEQPAPQMMCVPCDPCMQYDPCAQGGGMGTGYFGNYLGNADCGCEDGGAIQTVPTTMSIPQGATIIPQPVQ